MCMQPVQVWKVYNDGIGKLKSKEMLSQELGYHMGGMCGRAKCHHCACVAA